MSGIPFFKLQIVNKGLTDGIQYRIVDSVSNLNKKKVVQDDLSYK